MAKLFAKSGDLDQTPRSAESELGLHCLPFYGPHDYNGLNFFAAASTVTKVITKSFLYFLYLRC